MSIEYEARLIVGCSHGEIGVDQDKLDDLVSCDDVARYATFYDADNEYCNYGVEMSPEQLSTPEGAANAAKWIADMNRLLQTDKCRLLVTIDSY